MSYFARRSKTRTRAARMKEACAEPLLQMQRAMKNSFCRVRRMLDRYARIAKNRYDDCLTGGRIIGLMTFAFNKSLSCKFVGSLISLSLISASCNRVTISTMTNGNMHDAYVNMRPLLFII